MPFFFPPFTISRLFLGFSRQVFTTDAFKGLERVACFVCPGEEERGAGWEVSGRRRVSRSGWGKDVPWSTSCPVPHARAAFSSHTQPWRAQLSLPRESHDNHIFPTVPAIAFTSPKPNQGRSSVWCPQGWGSCAGPAAARGRVGVQRHREGHLMGQDLGRGAALGVPREGQTWLWQCRN